MAHMFPNARCRPGLVRNCARGAGTTEGLEACAASLDQPALLARDLLDVLEVLLDELVEIGAGQERVDLGGFLDVVLPLRGRLHLLHEINIERRLVWGDLAGEPHRPRLLILLDVETLLDAGRNVAPAFGRGDLGALRQPLRAENAKRPLRSTAPLPETFAGIVDVGVEVSAGELH